jgi:hypothetical protein
MSSTQTPFKRVIDLVVLTAFCLLQFAFVFGLPWFDYGLWPQVEGPAVAIHVLSAVLALGVGVQLALKDNVYLESARSPIILALFAFAFVSAALAPFSDDAARSLNGIMKHGIGAIWHLEAAVATLAAVALWQGERTRLWMLWGGIAAASVVLMTYVFPDSPVGTPLSFPEWSGMLALAVGGTTLLVASQEADKKRGRFVVLLSVVAALLITTGYIVSENRTLGLCLVTVAGYIAVSRAPVLRILSSSPAGRAVTAVGTALVLFIAIYAAAPFIETYQLSAAKPISGAVLSESAIDHIPIQDGTVGTVWSRSYLVRVQVQDTLADPHRLAFGQGFGSFSSAYERHAREVPGRTFALGPDTASLAYWDAHGSANFHSHNMMAETLASVGIFGVLTWLVVLAVMAGSSLAGATVALGIIVAGSFWFPLNHMIAPISLLTAAAVNLRPSGARSNILLSGMGSLLAVLGFSLFGYLGVASLNLAIIERAERGFPAVMVNRDQATCGFIKSRVFPEAEIVMDLYTILQNRVGMSKEPASEVFATTTNLIAINCMLRRYAEDEGNDKALVASLKGRATLVQVGPASFGALKDEILKWSDDLALLLDRIPQRTELLAPYFSVLETRAPHRIPEEIDRFLPRLRESDPIRHYLLAVRAGANGASSEKGKHMDKALALGLANLWPIAKR